jgi:hypothetical protein
LEWFWSVREGSDSLSIVGLRSCPQRIQIDEAEKRLQPVTVKPGDGVDREEVLARAAKIAVVNSWQWWEANGSGGRI